MSTPPHPSIGNAPLDFAWAKIRCVVMSPRDVEVGLSVKEQVFVCKCRIENHIDIFFQTASLLLFRQEYEGTTSLTAHSPGPGQDLLRFLRYISLRWCHCPRFGFSWLLGAGDSQRTTSELQTHTSNGLDASRTPGTHPSQSQPMALTPPAHLLSSQWPTFLCPGVQAENFLAPPSLLPTSPTSDLSPSVVGFYLPNA